MANNYLQFSEEITKLKPKEKEWILKELSPPTDPTEAFLDQWLKDHPIDDPDDWEHWPGFDWKIENEDSSLWLYAVDGGNMGDVIVFVQRFLKRWRPKQIFTLSWAETCSRPRIGEFGGGWLAVSANAVRSGHTREAAQAAKKELQKKS